MDDGSAFDPKTTNLGLRRRGLGRSVLAAGVVTCLPLFSIAKAQTGRIEQLTEFVFQDIEFMLASWIPPSENVAAIDSWVRATETSLERLTLISREGGLDLQVYDAIQKVDRIVQVYRDFLRDLAIIEFVSAINDAGSSASTFSTLSDVKQSYTLGFDLGVRISGLIAATSAEALKAVATSGTSLLISVGQQIAAEEQRAAVNKVKQAEKQRVLSATRNRIRRELSYLVDITASLRSRIPSIRLPDFNGLENDQPRTLRVQNTPFAFAAEGYQLLLSNRVEAAQCFTRFAQNVSKEVTSLPRAATYVAAFHLVAGHVLEFESRTTDNQALCQKAIEAFDKALSLLGTGTQDAPPFAYPYQIALARALAKVGERRRAGSIASKLENEGPGSSQIASAARAYDLAAIYSLLAQPNQAIEHLRKSYEVFPRRDPQALRDPLLQQLVAVNSNQVQDLVHPLIVGAWKLSSGSSRYIFYADGTLYQKRSDGEFKGRWAIRSGQLELTDRQRIPDVSVFFEVTSRSLTVTQAGVSYAFVREGDDGLLDGRDEIPSLSGRRLFSSGAWAWGDDRPTAFARFTTSISVGEKKRTYWYSYQDPVIGRVDQILEG